MSVEEHNSEEETMSDSTHEPKHGDWSYECIHCGEQDVPITEECPEHPDRQREDDDLTHENTQHTQLESIAFPAPCDYCHEWIEESDWDNPCPARQSAEDDDELGEWVNRRANLSDFELSDDEVQNVFEFIKKNDDLVGFISPDKEEANERLDKLIAVEATAGMLNDLSEEERKRYKEASERRPLFDEDDADGEGDVSREIAERFMGGEDVSDLVADHPHKSLLVVEQAIRAHCELSDSKIEWPVCHYCEPEGKTEPILDSEQAVTIHQYHLEELSDEDDGVCEWTWDDKNKVWDSDCGESFQFWEDGPEENNFEGCPFCIRSIETTTDEGGGFEVGDVVKFTHPEMDDYEWDYGLVVDFKNGDKPMLIDGFQNVPVSIEPYKIDKVGSFAPDDDALERVNPECNGSLFITDDKVLFDPLCRTEDIEFSGSELLFTDEGRGYQVQGAEATGIVLESFHQIAEE